MSQIVGASGGSGMPSRRRCTTSWWLGMCCALCSSCWTTPCSTLPHASSRPSSAKSGRASRHATAKKSLTGSSPEFWLLLAACSLCINHRVAVQPFSCGSVGPAAEEGPSPRRSFPNAARASMRPSPRPWPLRNSCQQLGSRLRRQQRRRLCQWGTLLVGVRRPWPLPAGRGALLAGDRSPVGSACARSRQRHQRQHLVRFHRFQGSGATRRRGWKPFSPVFGTGSGCSLSRGLWSSGPPL
mmetsp:Transcript_47125/g.118707  ORF Transcript_47125/g.118707 Transcript_47125/m.118707 type:complete len:241 (+) Transcript_47125:165-887(+)